MQAVLGFALLIAGAQAAKVEVAKVTVDKPSILEHVVDKAIPEHPLPTLPKKVNASLTFKTVTIPKAVPDLMQVEKDFIEKLDIIKPEVKLPKELPEPHKEKQLDALLDKLAVVANKTLANSKPDKFSNLDPKITEIYQKVKDDQDAKYAAHEGKVVDWLVKSIKNTRTVTIDTKHPNKTALVKEVHAAVDGIKADMAKPVFDKTKPDN